MKYLLACLLLVFAFYANAQNVSGYHSLDSKQPIVFAGDHIVYNGKQIALGPKAFLVDGQLPENITATYPFVFNTIQAAVEKISKGTAASPMTLYIAPYVYWIDDPDDTAVRVGANGMPPYGMIIDCTWLRFEGLNSDARNVVLACNRGQTIGSKGNFTMFRLLGDGISSENITFGNYCNVDLDYPLKPALSRKKRASAIVQAQLIHCNGDKIVARNTRFISRLNLCPFVGAKRILFDRCHFESTDDALCGTGVYLHSDFDVYGSKPFYRTIGTGAVMLDCLINSYVNDEQYFTKANGQLAVIDTRINTKPGTYIGWRDVVPAETKNYQYNVLQNGKPVIISNKEEATTVQLKVEGLLDAYRFDDDGKVVYNTYNLLKGDDDWDPMQIKAEVIKQEKILSKKFTAIPIQLLISPSRVNIETKKNDITLTAKALRFGDYPAIAPVINWKVEPGKENLVQLKISDDYQSCTIIPSNNGDEVADVVITASTPDGLEAASMITVLPAILPAPTFSVNPAIAFDDRGNLVLDYELNSKYKDESIITWYRGTDATGSNAIATAVGRTDQPVKDYMLSAGDVGYYIKAAIQPRHIRSDTGRAVEIVMSSPIKATQVTADPKKLVTDFKTIPTTNQSKVIPGFWTLAPIPPVDPERRFAYDSTKDAWYYGEGKEGAQGERGLLQGRSGRLRYTPVADGFSDMSLTIEAAPFKQAGQGFAVAPLYMDILIKFDVASNTGYGLRLIRTTKHHDAVDVYFVQYDHGNVTPISDAISTTAFRTTSHIQLDVKGNVLSTHMQTNAGEHGADGKPGMHAIVDIQTTIQTNQYGGFGIEFNGGSPVLFKDLEANWK